jgi:hypothetical protein
MPKICKRKIINYLGIQKNVFWLEFYTTLNNYGFILANWFFIIVTKNNRS